MQSAQVVSASHFDQIRSQLTRRLRILMCLSEDLERTLDGLAECQNLLSSLPLTLNEFSVAVNRLRNARRYSASGEAGAAHFELRLLLASVHERGPFLRPASSPEAPPTSVGNTPTLSLHPDDSLASRLGMSSLNPVNTAFLSRANSLGDYHEGPGRMSESWMQRVVLCGRLPVTGQGALRQMRSAIPARSFFGGRCEGRRYWTCTSGKHSAVYLA